MDGATQTRHVEILARKRRSGAPPDDRLLPNGKPPPFDPEGAKFFGRCGGPVLFRGRGSGGYPVIPAGVAGRSWHLWHWPWAPGACAYADGPWEIQGSLVASGREIPV